MLSFSFFLMVILSLLVIGFNLPQQVRTVRLELLRKESAMSGEQKAIQYGELFFLRLSKLEFSPCVA